MRLSSPVVAPRRKGDFVLRSRSLTKRYGDKVAVDALDLSLERGRIYGLIGRNGAGKTTTMRLLAGKDHRDAHDLWACHSDIW